MARAVLDFNRRTRRMRFAFSLTGGEIWITFKPNSVTSSPLESRVKYESWLFQSSDGDRKTIAPLINFDTIAGFLDSKCFFTSNDLDELMTTTSAVTPCVSNMSPANTTTMKSTSVTSLADTSTAITSNPNTSTTNTPVANMLPAHKFTAATSIANASCATEITPGANAFGAYTSGGNAFTANVLTANLSTMKLSTVNPFTTNQSTKNSFTTNSSTTDPSPANLPLTNPFTAHRFTANRFPTNSFPTNAFPTDPATTDPPTANEIKSLEQIARQYLIALETEDLALDKELHYLLNEVQQAETLKSQMMNSPTANALRENMEILQTIFQIKVLTISILPKCTKRSNYSLRHISTDWKRVFHHMSRRSFMP
ncbi:hypothetical protein B0J11DRAFT_588311 [Dendryphion nanum]|uniref:Uncharacterized protein n=1 Tax=Dendryphion nanum TaxID=256645 RepID=A0A9P9J0E1_9PLEO|nr:hypothetical protein B0J11DRAFT_588311 [Dendryphion nanum]